MNSAFLWLADRITRSATVRSWVLLGRKVLPDLRRIGRFAVRRPNPPLTGTERALRFAAIVFVLMLVLRATLLRTVGGSMALGETERSWLAVTLGVLAVLVGIASFFAPSNLKAFRVIGGLIATILAILGAFSCPSWDWFTKGVEAVWRVARPILVWGGVALVVVLVGFIGWVWWKSNRPTVGARRKDDTASPKNGTEQRKARLHKALSVLFILIALLLLGSEGLWPWSWFSKGSAWGWFGALIVAVTVASYWAVGSNKSWIAKVVGICALSLGVTFVAGVTRVLAPSSLAQAPLVAEASTVGINDPGYRFMIPMKIGDQPIQWNKRQACIPPHTTVGVRAEGYVNYDPTGGTLKELERGSPDFVRLHPELLQPGAFTVTPDGGMIEPDLMGSRDKFPLRNGWVGRPYVRLGSGPVQVVTSTWTEVANPTNLPQPLRVGLNLSTSMRQWTTGDEGGFTLFVRGIALPR